METATAESDLGFSRPRAPLSSAVKSSDPKEILKSDDTSGDNCNVTVAPLCLETITVHSGDVIDAIAFTYKDRNNVVHTAGLWGGSGGGVRQNSLAKIGLFGSTSGDNCNTTVAPLRLETITVHSGDVIDAIAFTYMDRNNVVHTAGPWGGSGAGVRQIKLGPLEFLTEIHGTYGPYTYGPHGRVEGITNHTFITNHGS
ncbi:hypothetical protein PR202_gb15944 [Eleusine coracana subsp. coracana]|uniref:Jacalin-type lectin domain-containing protein n=1 Tax=Eleusine coracana subsp. coracana TaxID=191504 RepID=A0AAV5EWU4_ELECO|nr:hypothetical protein PR202_gb15944 [Eleusine coracana subsp. coracana]